MTLTRSRTALSQDPTSPLAAPVAGIVAPAIPTAVPAAGAPAVTPAVAAQPTTGTGVPAAATAAQAITGIAPLSSVDTSQDLPAVQNASVEDALNSLLSQDSDLMKLARTQGLQSANQRGVLNSSIGVGAAQNAAIQAALPLAEQQSSQAFQSNSQRYDLASQMDRLRAQAGFEKIARAEGYDYQAALNTQGYAFQAQQQKNQNQFTKDMAAVQQGYAKDMAGLQYTLQSKLQSQANDEQIQRMAIDSANQLKLQSAQAQSTLDQIKAQGDVQLTLQANQFQEAMKELTLQLNSQDSVALANASVNLFNAEASLRAALLANPNIPASERAAYEQQITTMVQPVQNYISSVLGYVPSATTTPPATTPPPAPAPAPVPVPAPAPAPAPTGIATPPPVLSTPPVAGGGIAPVYTGGGGGYRGQIQ